MKTTVKLIAILLICALFLPISSYATLNETVEGNAEEEKAKSVVEDTLEYEEKNKQNSRYIFEAECTAPPVSLASILERLAIYMESEVTTEVSPDSEMDARSTRSLHEFSGYVYTKGQVRVPVYTATSDYTELERAYLMEDMQKNFPEAEVLAEPTTAYNCHSYAWYESNRFNQYWIYDVEIYMADIHSVELEEGENCIPGDIVVYRNENEEPLHSAVIVEIIGNQIICESKWGPMALVRHELEYVPTEYCTRFETISCSVYRVTSHDLHLDSYDASGHNFECQICPYSYTESHKMSALNVCRICRYSGPTIWN